MRQCSSEKDVYGKNKSPMKEKLQHRLPTQPQMQEPEKRSKPSRETENGLHIVEKRWSRGRSGPIYYLDVLIFDRFHISEIFSEYYQPGNKSCCHPDSSRVQGPRVGVLFHHPEKRELLFFLLNAANIT